MAIATPRRRALVTGGTRGIGLAICSELASMGYEVISTCATSESAERSGVETYVVDFVDQRSLEVFAEMVRGMGIDVLVNNAGINRVSPCADIDTQEFKDVQSVNVTAPMQLSRSVVGHMRDKGWGRIVNIGSIFGEVSREQRAAYSVSKFGLVGLTKAIAAEVARDGILVNCVSPGVIDTDLTREVLGKEGVLEICSAIPIGRLGRADEVAALVGFLASEKNSYMSGQSIVIDGGFVSV
jgi:NAD(P)-dependent dehydrogenase (short-subunit alcohol dehydrogenase family)